MSARCSIPPVPAWQRSRLCAVARTKAAAQVPSGAEARWITSRSTTQPMNWPTSLVPVIAGAAWDRTVLLETGRPMMPTSPAAAAPSWVIPAPAILTTYASGRKLTSIAAASTPCSRSSPAPWAAPAAAAARPQAEPVDRRLRRAGRRRRHRPRRGVRRHRRARGAGDRRAVRGRRRRLLVDPRQGARRPDRLTPRRLRRGFPVVELVIVLTLTAIMLE